MLRQFRIAATLLALLAAAGCGIKGPLVLPPPTPPPAVAPTTVPAPTPAASGTQPATPDPAPAARKP